MRPESFSLSPGVTDRFSVAALQKLELRSKAAARNRHLSGLSVTIPTDLDLYPQTALGQLRTLTRSPRATAKHR